MTRKVIIETRGTDLKPAIEIVDGAGTTVSLEGVREARYSLPVGATVFVDNGAEVEPGDIIANPTRNREDKGYYRWSS